MKVKSKILKESLGKRRNPKGNCGFLRAFPLRNLWGLQDPGAAVSASGRRPSLRILVLQPSLTVFNKSFLRWSSEKQLVCIAYTLVGVHKGYK